MTNEERIAIVAFANGAIYALWPYIKSAGIRVGRYCRSRATDGWRRAAQKLRASLD